MKTPILVKKNEAVIRKAFDSYSVQNYVTKNQSQTVSLAVGNAKNHKKTTQTSSDRLYYVLEGELVINKNLKAQKGDVVYIPKNIEYTYEGTFKAVIINSPAFKVEDKN